EQDHERKPGSDAKPGRLSPRPVGHAHSGDGRERHPHVRRESDDLLERREPYHQVGTFDREPRHVRTILPFPRRASPRFGPVHVPRGGPNPTRASRAEARSRVRSSSSLAAGRARHLYVPRAPSRLATRTGTARLAARMWRGLLVFGVTYALVAGRRLRWL